MNYLSKWKFFHNSVKKNIDFKRALLKQREFRSTNMHSIEAEKVLVKWNVGKIFYLSVKYKIEPHCGIVNFFLKKEGNIS